MAADAGAPDTSTAPAPGNAVKFFLDTDLVIDPGDMSALAMVHGLADRCEIEIIGMTGVTTAKGAAGAMDATNVYYGRPNIPVGALKGDTFLGSSPYASRITANYPNRFKNEADVPDATAVFRKVVAAQPDASVVVVAIGPQRNLRKFVESAADDASPLNGRDLIAKKVKLLSIMGGNFEKNEVEWNIEQDVESARIVTQKWPGRQVWGGFEAGVGFQPDRGIIAKRPKSPSTFALQNAGGNSGPRPGWDQTSILYGARAGSPYWGLSSAGRISVAGAGTTPFQKDAAGQHFFIADIHIDKIPAAELKDVPPDKEYGNMSAMMNDLQTAAGHVGACAPKGSQASKE